MNRAASLLLMAGLLCAADTPPQRPEQPDRCMVATGPALDSLVRAETAAFHRDHPDLTMLIDSRASDLALALLYTGRADLAVIGRRATDTEIKAYQWIYRKPAIELPLFTGSMMDADHSPSLAVIVNANNPIRAISLPALSSAFTGTDTAHWRDLDPSQAMRGAPVRGYVPDIESGTGRFIRHAVLRDATVLRWPTVREAKDPATAVIADRNGIAIAGGTVPAGTKRIPIEVDGHALGVDDPSYPLSRIVYGYGAIDDRCAAGLIEFMRGEAGQALSRASVYRPLAGDHGDVAK